MSLPKTILISKNGHRDVLDADAAMEFVFSPDLATRVSLEQQPSGETMLVARETKQRKVVMMLAVTP